MGYYESLMGTELPEAPEAIRPQTDDERYLASLHPNVRKQVLAERSENTKHADFMAKSSVEQDADFQEMEKSLGNATYDCEKEPEIVSYSSSQPLFRQ